MTELKPLYWKPEPGIGYTVLRRPDGGMTVTVTDLSDATIQHWRNFSLEHLLASDRLTRNLYDLRQVNEIPEKAVHAAIEVNSDKVASSVREMYYQSLPETSAAIKIFTDIDAAEAWLSRPLDQIL